MQSRILTQTSLLARVRIATMLFLGIFLTSGLVGTTWATGAGIPWQVGDVVVCYGSGSCNVLRIHGTSVQLLDTLSDGLLGSTGGAALNNSLHVLATDNVGGGQSKVVVYSIASINPFAGTPLNHSVISAFDASGGNGSSNAQAVALNGAGHIFVGNAGNGGSSPSIVELNANGTTAGNVFSFPTTGPCATTTLGSLDISANGDAIYVTAKDGVIRKVSLPLSASSACSQFANFGSAVTLYGIKDIPASALSGNCTGSVPCPTGESVLVVATGFTDPDGTETGETSPSDAVNICTNQADGNPISCALLLNTSSSPGLTAPLWQPGTPYFTVGSAILDPYLHQQTVTSAGTSGGDEPAFSQFGEPVPVMDNAVIWTDKGRPAWTANTPFTAIPFPGTYIVDTNSSLQTVTVTGTSGPGVPLWNTSGTTIDGLVWSDQGVWQASHTFLLGAAVGDAAGHPHTVLTAGTSGSGSLPAGGWNDSGSPTIDNAAIWTNQGPVLPYMVGHAFALNTLIVAAGHVQQAVEPGTSGGSTPSFSSNGGRTIDNAVTWTDQGQELWHPSFVFGLGALVVDPSGHVQLVTTAGTSGASQPQFTSNIPAAGQTTDGLQWTDQGVPGSRSSGSQANAVILDSNSPQHVQQAVLAGTPGEDAPIFSMTGGYTLDGSVVWLDRGVKTYQPGHPYNAGDAFFDGTDVQQATTAGTSGGSSPTFTDVAATVTPDNAVVWTDEGMLTWQNNFNYTATTTATTYIVDPANHVQQVTTAGMSGGSIPSPFTDGGTVIDGLVWMDIGPTVTWAASASYPSGTLLDDPGSFLQKVTTGGVSGTPSHPIWNETAGGTTIDGLQWTDQGHLVWQPSHPYFALGTLISDGATHAQKVTEAGTSGAGPAPTFSTIGGTTIDNAVTWTESHPSWVLNHPYVTGNTDTLILDAHNHVQLVSTSGISGPTTPPFTSNHPLANQTIDGLQWSNQATPATSVVARYPVAGVNTLQSLALDPLVANCTSNNNCSALPLPARKIANFWLGDSGSGSFYKLNFATGTPSLFTGGCPTGCGIQSLVIYGGEGANQPGLASLVSSGTLSSPSFTATAQFLQNTITATLSNTGSGSPPTTTISLYASLVDKTSCFNDPLAGNLPCKATVQVDPTKALVWKLDVPLNGTAGLPLTEALNTSFASAGAFGIDNSTDVFVDEQFDDTTFVGTDPGTRSISVHSLHEVPVTASQTQSQCTYSSPLPNACFKISRESFAFTFTCPGLTQRRLRGMHPILSLVKKNPPQSPQLIPVTEDNRPAAFRFDYDRNRWTFQWDLADATEDGIATIGTYQATTFDSTGVQSFTVNFSLKKSCP